MNIVTILDRFRDRPGRLTQRLKIAHYRFSIAGPVRCDRRPNFLTANIVIRKLEWRCYLAVK